MTGPFKVRLSMLHGTYLVAKLLDALELRWRRNNLNAKRFLSGWAKYLGYHGKPRFEGLLGCLMEVFAFGPVNLTRKMRWGSIE